MSFPTNLVFYASGAKASIALITLLTLFAAVVVYSTTRDCDLLWSAFDAWQGDFFCTADLIDRDYEETWKALLPFLLCISTATFHFGAYLLAKKSRSRQEHVVVHGGRRPLVITSQIWLQAGLVFLVLLSIGLVAAWFINDTFIASEAVMRFHTFVLFCNFILKAIFLKFLISKLDTLIHDIRQTSYPSTQPICSEKGKQSLQRKLAKDSSIVFVHSYGSSGEDPQDTRSRNLSHDEKEKDDSESHLPSNESNKATDLSNATDYHIEECEHQSQAASRGSKSISWYQMQCRRVVFEFDLHFTVAHIYGAQITRLLYLAHTTEGQSGMEEDIRMNADIIQDNNLDLPALALNKMIKEVTFFIYGAVISVQLLSIGIELCMRCFVRWTDNDDKEAIPSNTNDSGSRSMRTRVMEKLDLLDHSKMIWFLLVITASYSIMYIWLNPFLGAITIGLIIFLYLATYVRIIHLPRLDSYLRDVPSQDQHHQVSINSFVDPESSMVIAENKNTSDDSRTHDTRMASLELTDELSTPSSPLLRVVKPELIASSSFLHACPFYLLLTAFFFLGCGSQAEWTQWIALSGCVLWVVVTSTYHFCYRRIWATGETVL